MLYFLCFRKVIFRKMFNIRYDDYLINAPRDKHPYLIMPNKDPLLCQLCTIIAHA
jgi:hypothetical protein